MSINHNEPHPKLEASRDVLQTYLDSHRDHDAEAPTDNVWPIDPAQPSNYRSARVSILKSENRALREMLGTATVDLEAKSAEILSLRAKLIAAELALKFTDNDVELVRNACIQVGRLLEQEESNDRA